MALILGDDGVHLLTYFNDYLYMYRTFLLVRLSESDVDSARYAAAAHEPRQAGNPVRAPHSPTVARLRTPHLAACMPYSLSTVWGGRDAARRVIAHLVQPAPTAADSSCPGECVVPMSRVP